MILMIVFLAVILLIKYNPAFEYLEEENMVIMWYNANGKFGEKKRDYFILWRN